LLICALRLCPHHVNHQSIIHQLHHNDRHSAALMSAEPTNTLPPTASDYEFGDLLLRAFLLPHVRPEEEEPPTGTATAIETAVAAATAAATATATAAPGGGGATGGDAPTAWPAATLAAVRRRKFDFYMLCARKLLAFCDGRVGEDDQDAADNHELMVPGQVRKNTRCMRCCCCCCGCSCRSLKRRYVLCDSLPLVFSLSSSLSLYYFVL